MEEKKYTVELTEAEANAIVDAIEKIDGWVNNDALSSAAMKVVDKLNDL